jgi:hypothetical protein
MKHEATPEHLPEPAYDEKTLETARRILYLTMDDNDMARGARATAYALLLLSRLMYHYDKPGDLLPTTLDSGEEDLITDLLDGAAPVVLEKTGGKPLKDIVLKLVQETRTNRKNRRKIRRGR